MSKTVYDMIYEIDNIVDGIRFEKIEGVSILGDVRSDARIHPIQYYAYTNTRPGEDDPFEGVGWTPSEAIRKLLKSLEESK